MRQLIWEIVSLSVGAIWRWNWITAQVQFGYALSVGTVSNRLIQLALLHHNHRHLWIIEWMVQTYILIYTGIGWKIEQETSSVTELELLMCRLQHRFVRKANAGRDGASPAPSVAQSSVRFLRSKNLLDPSLKYPYGKKCPSFQLEPFFRTGQWFNRCMFSG